LFPSSVFCSFAFFGSVEVFCLLLAIFFFEAGLLFPALGFFLFRIERGWGGWGLLGYAEGTDEVFEGGVVILAEVYVLKAGEAEGDLAILVENGDDLHLLAEGVRDLVADVV